MRLMLIVASILAAAAAQAGNPPPGPSPGHAMDANQDGVVTREEARSFPRLAGSFDAWDKNRDGALDETEMNAHRSAMRAEVRAKVHERLKAADKDGNGRISKKEADASMPHLADRFDEMDVNEDGEISGEEMHGFRMAGRKQELGYLLEAFKAADKDDDGALDLAEAQVGMPMVAEHFSDLDANGDGKVKRKELKKAFKQRHPGE